MTTISAKALDWALLSIENSYDRDLFPPPIEFEYLRKNWGTARAKLASKPVTALSVRTAIRELTPKRGLGFRIATQLDPVDHVLYAAMIHEVGEDLEARRQPKSKKIVWSHRWAPNEAGRFFDPAFNWSEFVNSSLERAKDYKFVVVTDIADFFTRLYLHRIERLEELLAPAGKQHFGKALALMVKGWNESVSYGIPIGTNSSRFLADVLLEDIDSLLVAEGFRFARYADDFHIFCKSRQHAYEGLTKLARLLFQNHGLTLQESKTAILSTARFTERFSKTQEQVELQSMREKFGELLGAVGIESDYDLPNFEDLAPEAQAQVAAMNLDSMFESEVAKARPNVPLVQWVLRRLRELKVVEVAPKVVQSIEKLRSIIPDVAVYLRDVAPLLSDADIKALGKVLLKHIESGVGAYLPWHRAWLLHVFAADNRWNHTDAIEKLWSRYTDELTRRAVMQCLSVAKRDAWFRSRKSDSQHMAPWLLRAYLIGAKVLPSDELGPVLKARKPHMSEEDRWLCLDKP